MNDLPDTYQYYIDFSGEGFFPSKLPFLSEYNINLCQDARHVNRRGEADTHGHLSIETNGISESHLIATRIKNADSTINDIGFWVYRFMPNINAQCNFDFTSKEIKLMSELNAHFCISVCEDDHPSSFR